MKFELDADSLWFYHWGKKKRLSNRCINVVVRWMFDAILDMDDIVDIDSDEIFDIIAPVRGFGPITIDEFTSVFEDLKRDWKKEKR